jgi:hypothetical protein
MASTGTTATTTEATLAGKYIGLTIGVTAGAILLAGAVVIAGRWWLQGKKVSDDTTSFIRSWIAIALVSGLLIFCAVSFAVGDSNLRNTLFGGLLANVGAAVAFYFASKTSDQARQDILGATFGTTQVPPLTGKTVTDAASAMATSPLMLIVMPAGATGTITEQTPAAGTVVRQGASVTATVGT